MGRIRLMPDALANQIAAGEGRSGRRFGRERAGRELARRRSRSIAIAIEGSGKDRIRVADDGIGMSAEDARLALSRHATSKLFDASDLSNISSLGFRGEALPSIASVSRFTLRTREHEADAGHEVAIEGGQLVREAPVGVPPGTIVEVERLFFNVPARRKFLRADVTEAPTSPPRSRARRRLSRRGVPARARKRSVLEAPRWNEARASLSAREELGRERIVLEEEIGGLSIEAWLARPGSSRRREPAPPLRQRTAGEGPHPAPRGDGSLPAGLSRSGPSRLPLLELAPDKVDVNVHPRRPRCASSTSSSSTRRSSAVRNALQGQRLGPRSCWCARHTSRGAEPSMPGSTTAPPSPSALFEPRARGHAHVLRARLRAPDAFGSAPGELHHRRGRGRRLAHRSTRGPRANPVRGSRGARGLPDGPTASPDAAPSRAHRSRARHSRGGALRSRFFRL
jgi:DNA mismatch repair protein MutL